MGESKRKSRRQAEIVAAEPRCIYCANPAETLEHMPPISMFRERDRPRAMEFGACKDCNRGTRGADIVAAVFARMHPDHDIMSWQNLDIKHFVRDLDHDAPGVREELSQPGRQGALGSSARRRGCFRTSGRFALTAPWVNAYLTVFGAKLAMALYREHVGEALPMSGATWCQCRLNGSITQEYLDGLVEIMPGYETLRQGTKNVGDQFAYRFSTDERTVVAAVAQFHKGLWLTAFASSDERSRRALDETGNATAARKRLDTGRRIVEPTSSALVSASYITEPTGSVAANRLEGGGRDRGCGS